MTEAEAQPTPVKYTLPAKAEEPAPLTCPRALTKVAASGLREVSPHAEMASTGEQLRTMDSEAQAGPPDLSAHEPTLPGGESGALHDPTTSFVLNPDPETAAG